MKKRHPTPHVVFDTIAGNFLCQHCGERYRPALPASVGLFVGIAKAFQKEHRHCVPDPKDWEPKSRIRPA